MHNQGLFNNYKYCEKCNRPLPITFEGTICLDCVNQELFYQVKEYIRANDVTEYEVAEHFEIPLSKVKHWIREGRIEYKDDHLNSLITMHCRKCGAPIQFGTYCTKCQKLAGASGHSLSNFSTDDGHMRFIDKD